MTPRMKTLRFALRTWLSCLITLWAIEGVAAKHHLTGFVATLLVTTVWITLLVLMAVDERPSEER